MALFSAKRLSGVRIAFLFFAFGLFVQLVNDRQGIRCPAGDGLSLTLDRGSVIALHVDEKHPDIIELCDNVVSLIVRLRALGVAHPVMLKSWLFVSPSYRNNTGYG